MQSAVTDSTVIGLNNTIIFDRTGRADYAGSIVIGVGSDQRTIDVDPISGKVTVQP